MVKTTQYMSTLSTSLGITSTVFDPFLGEAGELAAGDRTAALATTSAARRLRAPILALRATFSCPRMHNTRYRAYRAGHVTVTPTQNFSRSLKANSGASEMNRPVANQ